MTDEQAERKSFENWIFRVTCRLNISRIPENTAGAGQYYDSIVQLAWEAWKQGILIAEQQQRHRSILGLKKKQTLQK